MGTTMGIETASDSEMAPRVGRSRLALITGLVALAAVGTGAFLTTRTDLPPPPPPPQAAPVTTTTTTRPPPPSPVPAETTIAAVTGPVAFHAEPDGAQTGTMPMGSWWKDTKYLPVIDERPDWLHVRLPERPNGSTAWIARSDATLSTTTYGILIDVTDYRLRLYERGVMVAEFPAGVGTADDPTPLGHYYVMDVADPPSSGWGPFILDTNAHSETITSWDGKGDAFTAIHGPLGDEHLIGTEGGAVSHGCVRLHSEHLAQLWPVPAGAPVVIVA